jgi:hypothetical protein
MEVLTVEDISRLYSGPHLPPKVVEVIVHTYNGIKIGIKTQQRIAYTYVEKALTSGELVRASICEDCGIMDLHLHGHHEDYDKPLTIEWLCNSCHRRRKNYIDMALFRLWEVLAGILQNELERVTNGTS